MGWRHCWGQRGQGGGLAENEVLNLVVNPMPDLLVNEGVQYCCSFNSFFHLSGTALELEQSLLVIWGGLLVVCPILSVNSHILQLWGCPSK